MKPKLQRIVIDKSADIVIYREETSNLYSFAPILNEQEFKIMLERQLIKVKEKRRN